MADIMTEQKIEDAKLWLNEQRQVVRPGPIQTCWAGLDVLTAINRRAKATKSERAAAHTPAPWLSGAHDDITTNDGVIIARVYRCSFSGDGLPATQIAANKRLIAAAPDGFALAQMIESAWGDRFDSQEEINGGDVVEWLGEIIPAARKLIAKAQSSRKRKIRKARRGHGDRESCRTCGQDIEWHGRSAGWRDRGGNRECVPYQHNGEIVQPKPGTKHGPAI